MWTTYYFPILSTSSISIRGFSVLVFLRHWITLPGIAPTYVLLCPLISATSVIPPTENRKYSLFRALAIERAKNKSLLWEILTSFNQIIPILVFPTPGGPWKHKIFP